MRKQAQLLTSKSTHQYLTQKISKKSTKAKKMSKESKVPNFSNKPVSTKNPLRTSEKKKEIMWESKSNLTLDLNVLKYNPSTSSTIKLPIKMILKYPNIYATLSQKLKIRSGCNETLCSIKIFLKVKFTSKFMRDLNHHHPLRK